MILTLCYGNQKDTTDNVLSPLLDYYGNKIRVKLNGSRLKQDKVTFAHKTIVNIYIVYELRKRLNISSYPTLENCLF